MKTLLSIQNLKCTGCASSICSALKAHDFVQSVDVDVDHNTVDVSYDQEANLPEIVETVSKLGYPQAGQTNPLTTKVKSFVSCARGKMN